MGTNFSSGLNYDRESAHQCREELCRYNDTAMESGLHDSFRLALFPQAVELKRPWKMQLRIAPKKSMLSSRMWVYR